MAKKRKRDKRKKQTSKSLPPPHSPARSQTGTSDSSQVPGGPVHSIQIHHEQTSGPLPAPEILRYYDEILPGLAGRIVTMAEEQAAHRRHLERTAIESNTKRERAGSISGPILFLAVLAFGGYLAHLGYADKAISTVVIDLVAFIGLIAWGYREGRGMLTRKREEAAPRPIDEDTP